MNKYLEKVVQLVKTNCMELILKYRYKIVSLGLLPTIGTLIGLHFLYDTYALGCGALVSLISLLYSIRRFKTLNFFLIQGMVSISLCFLMRLFTNYQFIPPGSITLVLELFLLICAFIHLTIPEYYQCFLKKIGLCACCSFVLETKIVVILSSIHLTTLFLSGWGYDQPTSLLHSFAMYGIPVIIYTLCMTINIIGIRIAIQEEFRNRNIRMVIVCEGKLYLSLDKNSSSIHSKQWDTPLSNMLEQQVQPASLIIRKIIQHHRLENIGSKPRHILTHQTFSACGHPYFIWLYILPISKADTALLPDGKLFSFNEILKNKEKFSPILLTELKHLKIAAKMWNVFGK